jgi:hypothetical protein
MVCDKDVAEPALRRTFNLLLDDLERRMKGRPFARMIVSSKIADEHTLNVLRRIFDEVAITAGKKVLSEPIKNSSKLLTILADEAVNEILNEVHAGG